VAAGASWGRASQADPAGDELDQWYRAHHRWLAHWLSGKLGCTHQAADVAQDTFVKVLGRWRRDGLPAAFQQPRALLVTVARGLLVDQWRRQDVERACLEALAQLPPEHAPAPEARMAAVQMLCRLHAVLERIAPRAQQVFLLSQVDGLPGREIAQRVGVSLATVERDLAAAWRACLALARDEGWA
jgi:RNA polymerase sigma-70 factor (ECF subfamily)